MLRKEAVASLQYSFHWFIRRGLRCIFLCELRCLIVWSGVVVSSKEGCLFIRDQLMQNQHGGSGRQGTSAAPLSVCAQQTGWLQDVASSLTTTHWFTIHWFTASLGWFSSPLINLPANCRGTFCLFSQLQHKHQIFNILLIFLMLYATALMVHGNRAFFSIFLTFMRVNMRVCRCSYLIF